LFLYQPVWYARKVVNIYLFVFYSHKDLDLPIPVIYADQYMCMIITIWLSTS